MPLTVLAIRLIGFSLVATASVAQDVVRAVPLPPFKESVQEEVSVSGSVVVGVAAASAQIGAQLLSGIRVPLVEETMCVTIRSRDGIYYSRNAFKVESSDTANATRAVAFSLALSQQKSLLQSLGPAEVALAVQPGSCESPANRWLLAVANTSDLAAELELLVNSFDATDVFTRTSDGSERQCEEILEGRRSAYDFRCRIVLAGLNKGTDSVEIHRERFGRPMPTVAVELVTAASE